MPKQPTYDHEDVIRAALECVRAGGMKNLTARHVAQGMGASTAPVYYLFDSMDDLTEAVLTEIKRLALAEMHVERTDRRFLNIGMGFAVFARDEPRLFRALHLENRSHRRFVRELFDDLTESMKEDPRFSDMPATDRAGLLSKMWTYTFGLSIELCFGFVEDTSDAWIENNLTETGTIIIADALARHKTGTDAP